jgi:Ankyrin repeats (3 copies)
MNIEDHEQFKRTIMDLRERFKYLPEASKGPAGEAITEWDMELESRYRADGLPVRPVDLNYGRAQVELQWLDDTRCVLRCQLGADKRNLRDLHAGGERAVLAVHRYIGRISKIRGVERADWLGNLLVAYCAHGGPKEYDTTDLMRAAEKWSSGRVRSLLTLGVDVNDENLIGETALSYAAREGRHDIFEILLGNGARVDLSFEGYTPLHDAAAGGSVPIISHLIRSGLQVNSTNWMGLTPLWWAVSQGKVEAAEYLLAEGADWKVEPWKTESAYPKMKEGFDLVCQAEATLGQHHRLTKMLRDLRK